MFRYDDAVVTPRLESPQECMMKDPARRCRDRWGSCKAMNSVGAATPMDLSGVYKVGGSDTWDNFVIEAAGALHRYALSASKGLGQKRHLQAALRHAVSTDDGVNWQDLDVVLKANNDGTWPDLVIWGSNGVYRDVPDGGKEFLLFVTGRSKADGELQRIGLAKSANGQNFSRPKVVLDPTPKMGYDITDSDRIIMAWRDPFVFRDHQDDRWHMLFTAKAAMPAGTPLATVGHAIAQDDDLEQWELQPPLQLPRHYRQLEVPSLVQRPGRYYLFVSTQNRPLETDNAAKQAAFRGYVASSLLDPGSSSMAILARYYGESFRGFGISERSAWRTELAGLIYRKLSLLHERENQSDHDGFISARFWTQRT